MRIRATIAEIEEELRAVGSADRASGEKRYLKSELQFLGVPVPRIKARARAWLRSHDEVSPPDLRRLVEGLWRRPIHESRSFGVELLAGRRGDLVARDLELLEWVLRRANTWAHVDPVATRIVGPLVEQHPELQADLDRWAADEDLWLRRAALLAHIPSLRKGSGSWQEFQRHASPMLEVPDFFIRKAIGWVLREAGKIEPDRVEIFLRANLDRVSGVTFREAIKPLAQEDRDLLLEAYRNRPAQGRLKTQNS